MRKALVLLRNIPAGTLTEESPSSYVFRYLEAYLMKEELPPVSLTMPKTSEEYRSPHLFPVFFNMLSEGVNKEIQCRHFHLDEKDRFFPHRPNGPTCFPTGRVTIPFDEILPSSS